MGKYTMTIVATDQERVVESRLVSFREMEIDGDQKKADRIARTEIAKQLSREAKEQ